MRAAMGSDAPLLRLPLARFTRRDVTDLRALLHRLAPASLTLDAPRWVSHLGGTLTATPLAPARTSRDEARRVFTDTSLCAVLAVPDADVAVLALDRPFALRLAQRALGLGDDEAHAPPALLSPAHEGALFALLSRLCDALDGPAPVLRAITDDAPLALDAMSSDDLLAWPFALAFDGHRARATLLVSRDAMLRLPVRSRPARGADAVPLRVSLVAARDRWSLDDVLALTVGEVIACEGMVALREGLSGEAWLCAGNVPLARITAATPHTITRLVAHDDEEPMDDSRGPIARLGRVPVEVSVELARTTMRVADLAALLPGEVVRFDDPVGTSVTLCANGAPIADGELVDVDGAVGVRITALRSS